jgi:hypothetical protein
MITICEMKRNNSQIHFEHLTPFQKEVLVGGLLGDAALALGKRAIHPALKIERKLTDIKYLEWQYKCFDNLCTPTGIRKCSSVDKRTNQTYYCCRFLTRAVPEFLPIYQQWYPDGIKIVPRNIMLTPLIAAVWFADDGYIKHSGKSELILSLATDGFSYDDVVFLSSLLNKELNEEYNIFLKGKSKNGKYQYVIQSSSSATYAFIKYIMPELSNISMDRKNVWSNINLEFSAQSKRSARYYQLADVILKLNTFSVKDIVPLNIYSSKTTVSSALLNFYKLEYFTRFRNNEGEGYCYTLTPIGKKYFQALQFEQKSFNTRIN